MLDAQKQQGLKLTLVPLDKIYSTCTNIYGFSKGT